MIGHNGIIRTSIEGLLPEQLELRIGVRWEFVHRNHHRHAEFLGDLDHVLHIRGTLVKEIQVLFLVLLSKGQASHHLRPPSVHLQGPHRSDEHDTVGLQSRVTALDVHELLHADVRAESSLRDDVAVGANHAQADLIGDDGAVAMGDVGERPCVDNHRSLLQRLHQVGLHSFLHEDGQGASDTEVVGGHGVSLLVQGDDHLRETLAHVRQGRSEGEDCHDL
mmetsp:Transcript_7572/g.14756  ORF Transcript_7572/g.14756 Transcript_7572/m.14756 type:complete len:221 (+) Transcript_7572:632-1294(+)